MLPSPVDHSCPQTVFVTLGEKYELISGLLFSWMDFSLRGPHEGILKGYQSLSWRGWME